MMLLPILGILLAISLTFNLLAAIGILRFPDVYNRLHASTKCTTFGSIFMSLSVIIYSLDRYLSDGSLKHITLTLHVLVALACVMLGNPVGSHAIARAAHRSGVLPALAVVDRFAEEEGR